MNHRSRFFLSSALGAVAIHVLFVACSSPSAPSSATDSGVMNMIRDVMNIEVPDANAQVDAGTCNCPPAPQTYYSEASAGVTTTGMATWVDVPGLQLSFTSAGTSTVELFTLVAVSADAGSTHCSIRFTVDGAAAPQVNSVEASGGANAPYMLPWVTQLTGMRQLRGIPAGMHRVSVQVSKDPGILAGSNCVVSANGRLRAMVQPQ